SARISTQRFVSAMQDVHEAIQRMTDAKKDLAKRLPPDAVKPVAAPAKPEPPKPTAEQQQRLDALMKKVEPVREKILAELAAVTDDTTARNAAANLSKLNDEIQAYDKEYVQLITEAPGLPGVIGSAHGQMLKEMLRIGVIPNAGAALRPGIEALRG